MSAIAQHGDVTTDQAIAVLLMAMGGPDSLDNVEPYLMNVRGGRPTSPELVAEIRERYRRTGGKSPVLEITREVATLLEQRLNREGDAAFRVYVGLRHWHPFIHEVMERIVHDKPKALIGMCMAPQYSTMSVQAYIRQAEEAWTSSGEPFPAGYVRSWARHPLLARALADQIRTALERFPAGERASVPIVFTAHSLPERVVKAQDPYPDEVRGTMEAVCEKLGDVSARLAFQSQGRSNEPWLGPTVEEVLDELAARGERSVLVAPIGFVSDHIEILYDLDIEAKAAAVARGIRFERMPMLNASLPMIEALASVVEDHLTYPAA